MQEENKSDEDGESRLRRDLQIKTVTRMNVNAREGGLGTRRRGYDEDASDKGPDCFDYFGISALLEIEKNLRDKKVMPTIRSDGEPMSSKHIEVQRATRTLTTLPCKERIYIQHYKNQEFSPKSGILRTKNARRN